MYPILLELGPITISSLWLFISLAFVAGSLLFGRLAHKNRLNIDIIAGSGFKILLSTLVVSRAVFVITHIPLFFYAMDFSVVFDLFRIWDKGMSFWGAVAGFLWALYSITKKHGVPFQKWLDLFALSLSGSFIIGTVGTFLDGVNYGRATSLPWGVTFESPIVKYAVPIHPTQIYALLYSVIITILLLRLYREKRGNLDGMIFEYGVFLYAGFRFVEEFFRGDDVMSLFGIIRVPQIIALAVAVFMGRHLYKKRGHGENNEPLQRSYLLRIFTTFFSKARSSRSIEKKPIEQISEINHETKPTSTVS